MVEEKGLRRVELTGLDDKRMITAVFCGTLSGDFLPIQVIYQGKTSKCHPVYQFPEDWHITQSPKHWSTEETMRDYFNHIIFPYVDAVRDANGLDADFPALAIFDNFKGQVTPDITQLLEEHNIHAVKLPPNCTDRLQPMDISVNKAAKDFLRQKFTEWYAEQVAAQLEDEENIDPQHVKPNKLTAPVMKSVGARWIVQMYEYIQDNPAIIVNGSHKAGIPQAI